MAEEIIEVQVEQMEEAKITDDSASTPSTKDKAKWLESEMNKGPMQKEHAGPISKDLATERATWLMEQVNRGPEVKEHNEPVSRELAAEKAKWLMEQANKGPVVAAKNEPVSRERATERAKFLTEQANKTAETYSPAREVNVSRELATQRAKEFEEQMKQGKTPVKAKGSTEPITRNLAAEKMKAIQEQQEAFAKKGKKNEDDNVAPPVSRGNLAAERIASIKAEQDAFAKKGQRNEDYDVAPPVSRGNLAAERMASIKAQQEAFTKKGQRNEDDIAPPVSRGNLAAERMASIKAQQEAFANKGKKVDAEDKQDEEVDGIKAVANKFGATVKPKSAVQRRMEEFERKQKEEAMKNDPTTFQKVSWGSGSGYGQFNKKVKDSRGSAPKKSFSDLP